ncbi:MAG TPA: hypothetical protein VMM13_13860, partial [Euzebya sp.]|nr:hypothetical protein [Euzebya sp.]
MEATTAAALWDRRLADLHRDELLLLRLLVAGQPADAGQLALLAHRPADAVTTRLAHLARRGHVASPVLRVQPESLVRHLHARLDQTAVTSVRRRMASLGTAVDPVPGPAAWPAQPLARPRLQRLLEDTDGVRAVTVIADAGFGKTTLLGQWAAGRPTAWLSLHTAHDAPERLAADLLDRLPGIAPRLPVEALRPAVMAPRGPDAAGAHGRQVAALLCEALDSHGPDPLAPEGRGPQEQRRDGRALLILDDVHLLSDPEAVGLVDGLVRGTPGWLLVVLAGRGMPPIPLDRLRAAGELRAVHGTDLAFDPDEVRAALALHLDPSSHEAGAAVHDLTDGWPMAVWLVAAELGRRPGSDPATVIGRLRRPGQPLFAALVDDVLATCDPPLRQVLRAATALPSLPAGLAAAIGLPDAERRLADLADRGLFLDEVASGEHRLKDLVAEALVNTDPLTTWEARSVLRCAAAWFDDHERPLDALRCLGALAGVTLAGVEVAGGDLAGGDLGTDALRAFLSRRGHELVDGGAAREVLMALDALPVPLTAAEHLLVGSVSQVLGDWERALHAFKAAAGDGPDLPAGLAWRIAMIHHHQGDVDAALEACRAGRRDGTDPVEEAILGGWVAALHWMRAEAEVARTAAEEAHALALRTGDPRALATTHAAMAMVSAMLGYRDADAAHYERALAAARKAGDLLQQVRALVNRSSHHDEGGAYAMALADADEAVRLAALGGYAHWGALAQVNRGEALKRTGRLDEALQAYGEAHRTFRGLGSRLVCYPLIEMAEVRAERGDRARALVELRQGIALAQETGDHQVLLLALALQARLLAPDDLESAQHSLDLARRTSPGMRGVWVELAAGWVGLARGDRAAAAHHAAEALAAAEGRADRHHAADAQVLAALAADPPDADGLAVAEAVWHQLGDPASEAFAVLLRARLTGADQEEAAATRRLQSLGALGPL